MAEGKKSIENKKTTPGAAKTKTMKAEPAKTTETAKSNQSVIIAVLATALVCLVLVFGALLATGVIKFGGNSDSAVTDRDGTNLNKDNKTGNGDQKTGDSNSGTLIDNPNPKVRVKDATLANVDYLEFYLPDDFKAGGKNKDGAYTYNLEDDDGWAQVLVYTEKSNLTPEKYLMKISPYLDITNTNYVMNGTTWVVGENANALAYATELDGVVYAVYYNVKLDSEETGEAMQMIPKTLYMNKIYAE